MSLAHFTEHKNTHASGEWIWTISVYRQILLPFFSPPFLLLHAYSIIYVFHIYYFMTVFLPFTHNVRNRFWMMPLGLKKMKKFTHTHSFIRSLFGYINTENSLNRKCLIANLSISLGFAHKLKLLLWYVHSKINSIECKFVCGLFKTHTRALTDSIDHDCFKSIRFHFTNAMHFQQIKFPCLLWNGTVGFSLHPIDSYRFNLKFHWNYKQLNYYSTRFNIETKLVHSLHRIRISCVNWKS